MQFWSSTMHHTTTSNTILHLPRLLRKRTCRGGWRKKPYHMRMVCSNPNYIIDIIKVNKPKYKKYSIDQILAEHNHSILWLPSYLNPIEMERAINGYVVSKNVTWNVTRVLELVKEKVLLMQRDEWSKLCGRVKKLRLTTWKVIIQSTQSLKIFSLIHKKIVDHSLATI